MNLGGGRVAHPITAVSQFAIVGTLIPTASSSLSAGSHFSLVHFLDGYRIELIERS
jgi:hypothetical protein